MNGRVGNSFLVQAIVQGVVTVLLVLAACYCWVCEIALPSPAGALLWAVLAGYFGFSAYQSTRDARYIDQIRARWRQEKEERGNWGL